MSTAHTQWNTSCITLAKQLNIWNWAPYSGALFRYRPSVAFLRQCFVALDSFIVRLSDVCIRFSGNRLGMSDNVSVNRE